MRIGIIGAMDVEVDLLKEHLSANGPVAKTTVGRLEFYTGAAARSEVVVVQCGVGMVNAAVAAQVLVERFEVDSIVNTGVAGSLDAGIDIGDIVVASDAVNHVMDVCNLGYALGQTPGLDTLSFPCSQKLSDLAVESVSALGIACHRGRVASGDRFVRTDEDKTQIRDAFAACCCEMEGAAIAQVAWLMSVPCLILRAISDKADGTEHIDYPAFEAKAARDCASLLITILEKLDSEVSL